VTSGDKSEEKSEKERGQERRQKEGGISRREKDRSASRRATESEGVGVEDRENETIRG
jgi:hypothetical protein